MVPHIPVRHDDANRMQMQQTLDDEDDEDDEDDGEDDEAVDDDEDHVDASSAATAPDVEYARSRRTLVLGYVTAHETNISELSGVCGKLRPRVSSQTFSRSLSLYLFLSQRFGSWRTVDVRSKITSTMFDNVRRII